MTEKQDRVGDMKAKILVKINGRLDSLGTTQYDGYSLLQDIDILRAWEKEKVAKEIFDELEKLSERGDVIADVFIDGKDFDKIKQKFGVK